MPTTIRLSKDLEDAASAYSKALGISFNALVAVALRDYLDARKPGLAPAPGPDKPVPPLAQDLGRALAGAVPGGPPPGLTRQQRRAWEREQLKKDRGE